MTNIIDVISQLNYKDKLLAVIREGKVPSKSELARMMDVTYRQMHRWLDEGMEPSRLYCREIEELYRRYVDISPQVLKSAEQLADPLTTLRENSEIREKFFVKMIYHSNAIEGSPMTEKDTLAVMHGQIVRGADKNLAAHMEVSNHRNAMDYLLKSVEKDFKITEEYVLKLHALVMGGFMQMKPGEYRDGYVNLTNTDVITPSAQEVPGRMKEWYARINIPSENPIFKAAQDHHDFELIHPFFDGNGRVGRLVMATQLMSVGLPPAVIRIEERYHYYMGLERWVLGEKNYLVSTVAEGVAEGMRILGL